MKFDFGKMLFLAIFMSIFGLGGLVWPIFVFGLIVSSMSSSKKTVKRQPSAKKNTIGKAKIARAERLLKEYFEKNSCLVLGDGVTVEPLNGRFTTAASLYLYKDHDQIATLEEFRRSFPSTYEDLLEQCRIQIEKGPVQMKDVQHNDAKQEVLNEIEEFIDRLNELNIEISDEKISNGLFEVTAYLKQINGIVKQFPESKEKTKKLTQYYLPILSDILESYQQLNSSVRNHEEFKQTEQRLHKTILLINEALKTISYSLTQEYFMDLSADMKTLEALLKKDGLVSEGTLNSVRKQVKTDEAAG